MRAKKRYWSGLLLATFLSMVSQGQEAPSSKAPRRGGGRQAVIARIDVGNTAAYRDKEGRLWSPDVGLFSPARAFAESRGEPEIVNAIDPTIYRTYRGNVGGSTPQAERLITFEIPVAPARTVDLRLHFAEIYWGAPGGGPPGPGRRIFDILAEGRPVITDFDITRAAGGHALRAVVLPLKGIRVKDGALTLTLQAKKDFPAISAIEVLGRR